MKAGLRSRFLGIHTLFFLDQKAMESIFDIGRFIWDVIEQFFIRVVLCKEQLLRRRSIEIHRLDAVVEGEPVGRGKILRISKEAGK